MIRPFKPRLNPGDRRNPPIDAFLLIRLHNRRIGLWRHTDGSVSIRIRKLVGRDIELLEFGLSPEATEAMRVGLDTLFGMESGERGTMTKKPVTESIDE